MAKEQNVDSAIADSIQVSKAKSLFRGAPDTLMIAPFFYVADILICRHSFDTIGFFRYITGIYVLIYCCLRAFRKICLDKNFSLS